jgi:hypothetical protein
MTNMKLGTTFLTGERPPASVFVRIKRTRGRRYVYVVEGVRKGDRVGQKVVCYLGPLPRVAYGVPAEVAARAARRRDIDWRLVNDAISRIPLTFEELSEARRASHSAAVGARRQGFLTQGSRRRVAGEGDALCALASSKFHEIFVEAGKERFKLR